VPVQVYIGTDAGGGVRKSRNAANGGLEANIGQHTIIDPRLIVFSIKIFI